MISFRRKYTTAIITYTVLLAVVSGLLYEFAIPQFYIGIFPYMILYFCLLGFFGMFLYSWSLAHTPKRTASLYLTIRMIRMVLSVLIAFVYCILNRQEVVTFLLTFALVYLLYMCFETWFYYTNRTLQG